MPIYDLVATETNRYAKQRLDEIGELPRRSRFRQWKDVHSQEIKAMVAMEIGKGLVHKPTLQSYFQDSYWLTRTPGFGNIFSRDQYMLLKSFVHFANNEDQGEDDIPDRLFKVRKLIDLVSNTYAAAYIPNKEICVDESMLKFKGRLFWKQYLPSKPSTKWGIKLWSFCDSHTGFLVRFQIYTGKEAATQEHGLGYRVVKDLLQGYENQGYIVYMDNFYSSLQLYEYLRVKKIGACGTVRANRKGLPKEMKNMKPKRGALPTIWENANKTMLACTWQDTGKVNMLATVGNVGVTGVEVHAKTGLRTVKKPNIQVMYNKHMGGVDKFDQLCSTYPFERRHKKWYQTLWHFFVETALVNGCICYNIQNPLKKMSQRTFRENVIDGLLQGYNRRILKKRGRRSNDPTDLRLVQRHFPRNNKLKQKSAPNCVVCSILPSECTKKGKGSCKRKQTSYYCEMCVAKPPLCIAPCFEEYHTKVKYKKTCACTANDD
ncbi:piggyBac transposable element-derived protein 4-like [Homarus americanus]|uniref:piggyBac transposable element-derived protein 4-like n=1 Tax=Homarus americanus TaxID=6706 RepID=UPI001C449A73|nr:piggyBac transposable element-derived protein 4-like [Homarus americanus]